MNVSHALRTDFALGVPLQTFACEESFKLMELQILPFAQPIAILVEAVRLVLVTIAADGVMKSRSVLLLPPTCLCTHMGNAKSTK